jgi:hypothetical protein
MADEQQRHDILNGLEQVLAPLDADKRAAILELAEREINERALIATCWDGSFNATKDQDAGYMWHVGQASPMDPGKIVFAMLLWEELRAVVAYCVGQRDVEGGVVFDFTRELIFNPKYAGGPMSHEALFRDMMMTLTDDDDEIPEATNGARALARS